MIRVVSLATVFPNPRNPVHGRFVLERLRHTIGSSSVSVVAPVGWTRQLLSRVPAHEVREGLDVYHPTYWYSPGVGKGFDGWCLFRSTRGVFRELQRAANVDLIDAHFLYPDGVAAIALARDLNSAVTITLRGSEPDLSRNLFRRAAMQRAVRQAPQIIAVSEQLGQLAISLGAPPEAVTVIPNGVDAHRFTLTDASAARRQLQLPVSGPLLVSVGHICPRKGFHLLIDAFSSVLDCYPDCRLVIVGGPSAEPCNLEALQHKVRSLGMENTITFVGAQSPDRVALWLSASDVFVLASQHEGSPNVVWESLACGRPVVASAVGEIERMVPAYAGIVFSPPDSVRSLQQALTSALGRHWDSNAIRAHAERHTWAGVARQVEHVWQRAVERKRRRTVEPAV